MLGKAFILITTLLIFSGQLVFAYSIGDLTNYLQNLFYTVTQPVVIGSTLPDNCCCESTSGTRSCISRSTCWNGQGCVGNCPCSSATTTTVNAACSQECANRYYVIGTCRTGNICYSSETDIGQGGCPSYNKCCCSVSVTTTTVSATTTRQTTTTGQTTTSITTTLPTSQSCDYQSGYRCMPNACYTYQQPCGSTNVYSCQDKNMKCCFGTCSGTSTTVSGGNCCCETSRGRSCMSVSTCGAACRGECPCPTTSSSITTTTQITTSIIGTTTAKSTTTTISSCSYGTADATYGVDYGDYIVYATEGSTNSWAKIVVKKGANIIDTKIINQGSYADFTALYFRVDVITVRVKDGNVVGVDLTVGPLNVECVGFKPITTTISTTVITTTQPPITTTTTPYPPAQCENYCKYMGYLISTCDNNLFLGCNVNYVRESGHCPWYAPDCCCSRKLIQSCNDYCKSFGQSNGKNITVGGCVKQACPSGSYGGPDGLCPLDISVCCCFEGWDVEIPTSIMGITTTTTIPVTTTTQLSGYTTTAEQTTTTFIPAQCENYCKYLGYVSGGCNFNIFGHCNIHQKEESGACPWYAPYCCCGHKIVQSCNDYCKLSEKILKKNITIGTCDRDSCGSPNTRGWYQAPDGLCPMDNPICCCYVGWDVKITTPA